MQNRAAFDRGEIPISASGWTKPQGLAPNWPALTSAWSWIHGTRVAKEPVTEPCTAKTAATAYRARFTSPRP